MKAHGGVPIQNRQVLAMRRALLCLLLIALAICTTSASNATATAHERVLSNCEQCEQGGEACDYASASSDNRYTRHLCAPLPTPLSISCNQVHVCTLVWISSGLSRLIKGDQRGLQPHSAAQASVTLH